MGPNPRKRVTKCQEGWTWPEEQNSSGARAKMHLLPLWSVVPFAKEPEQPLAIVIFVTHMQRIIPVLGSLQGSKHETWELPSPFFTCPKGFLTAPEGGMEPEKQYQFSTCLCKADFTILNGNKCNFGLLAHPPHRGFFTAL